MLESAEYGVPRGRGGAVVMRGGSGEEWTAGHNSADPDMMGRGRCG